MKVNYTDKKLANLATDLLVIPVAKKEISSTVKTAQFSEVNFDACKKWLGSGLLAQIKQEKYTPSFGKQFFVRTFEKNIKNLLLTGAPETAKGEELFDALESYRQLGASIFNQAQSCHCSDVTLSCANLDLSDDLAFRALIEGILIASYSFDKYKSKTKKTFSGISKLTIAGKKKVNLKIAKEVEIAVRAMDLARDLVNTPAGDCTPNTLLSIAKRIAKDGKFKLTVFDKAKLKVLKADSLLSVAQGSDQPVYLIRIEYRPKQKSSKKIGLVGKGITFDSGGYSIKPASGMETMKMDMAGAAAVLGTMKALVSLKPSVAVTAYVPTCENMINGKATKPGDVVKAMNGKTIEVLNTDAEGRLILADALCMAERDGCNEIVDLATLTGACVVALGPDIAGLFSPSKKLSKGILNSAEKVGERFWEMPLPKHYKKLIESNVADIKNVGGRWGGAITAALFLQEFISRATWAHLDIAGPAFSESTGGYLGKGGVGFGVRTLIDYLDSQ